MLRFILLFLFILGFVQAKAALYFDKTGDEINYLKSSLQNSKKGYVFSLENENFQIDIQTQDKRVTMFKMIQQDEQKSIESFQKLSKVYVKYQEKNKVFKNLNFEISNHPWIQNFILLEEYMNGFPQRFEFLLFSIEELKFRNMILTKKENESINLEGIKLGSVKYALNVKGIPGFLWTAHIWLDAQTGEFLKYKGLAGGPGSPQKIFQKVFEKNTVKPYF